MVVVIDVCDRVLTPFEVTLVRTRLGDIGQSQRLTTLPPASGFTHTKARSPKSLKKHTTVDVLRRRVSF